MQDLAARIDNLEMKVTYQDEVIEKLNSIVIQQWGQLDQFQRRIDRLERYLRDAQDNPARDPREEPPPPHW